MSYCLQFHPSILCNPSAPKKDSPLAHALLLCQAEWKSAELFLHNPAGRQANRDGNSLLDGGKDDNFNTEQPGQTDTGQKSVFGSF